jgi:hypothetical protein
MTTEQPLSTAAPAKRTRRYMKRAHFSRCPRPAVPVRGLWEVATAEEKAAAHRTCAVMLEHWLGRKSREQASSELGVTPLRLWHLSQQAVSGMLAGLLVQPRRRGRAIMRQALEQGGREDLSSLKKENAELRRKLQIAESAIRILRDLPGHRDKPDSLLPSAVSVRTARRGEKRKRAGRRQGAASSRDATLPGPAAG